MARLAPASSVHRALVLALIGALPAGGLAIVTAGAALPRFWDPCHEWGVPEQGNSAGPGDTRCQDGASASSQTATRAAWMLVVVQGGILAAVALGLVGAWRLSARWLVAAAAVLVVESVPILLGGAFVLTLLSALLFALAARMVARRQGPVAVAAPP